jgi:hypothetical protein
MSYESVLRPGRKHRDARHCWPSRINDRPPFARFRTQNVSEKALLRCFYPFAPVLGLAVLFLAFLLPVQYRGTGLDVAGIWIFLVLAHLPAALWLWALIGLVSVWNDASFHGLRRYAATAMLFGFYGSAGLIFLCDFLGPVMRNIGTD